MTKTTDEIISADEIGKLENVFQVASDIKNIGHCEECDNDWNGDEYDYCPYCDGKIQIEESL